MVDHSKVWNNDTSKKNCFLGNLWDIEVVLGKVQPKWLPIVFPHEFVVDHYPSLYIYI